MKTMDSQIRENYILILAAIYSLVLNKIRGAAIKHNTDFPLISP